METLRKVIRFYVEGFREMTVGRTLWAIILIKLFILSSSSPTCSRAKAPRKRPAACWKT